MKVFSCSNIWVYWFRMCLDSSPWQCNFLICRKRLCTYSLHMISRREDDNTQPGEQAPCEGVDIENECFHGRFFARHLRGRGGGGRTDWNLIGGQRDARAGEADPGGNCCHRGRYALMRSAIMSYVSATPKADGFPRTGLRCLRKGHSGRYRSRSRVTRRKSN